MWTDHLKVNPLGILLGSDDVALVYAVERDLLGRTPGNIEDIWDLDHPQKLFARQRMDGAWVYKGNRPGDEFGENYELLQTWRNLRVLIEIYAFTREHPAVERAAEFIFSCQTTEGDIRGILSNQYTPYYMGAMMETLIKAGYAQDERIMKGFEWLLSMRQEDGGWVIPLQQHKMQAYYRLYDQPPILPERERPFSHMASGMVLRAFAAHPVFRARPEAIAAGNLLKARLFKKDAYTSRQAVDYWFKFQFPFWWTDLLTALDSLMRMEFPKEDREIQKAVDWFIQNQAVDGTWKSTYGGLKNNDPNSWVTFAICRVLRYFLD
jgi:hypothetical protein